MSMERAETLASQALAWLSGQPDLIGRFLASTGLSAADVAAMVQSAEGLAAVLDFVLTEDQMVLELAQHLRLRPEDILRARAHLPGGDLPHWT